VKELDCQSVRAAWSADPDVESSTDLARCELGIGHAADAARLLSPYMQRKTGSKAEVAAEEVYDAARARVLTVFAEIDLAGADVTVDGAPAGKAPLDGPLFLAPGPHTIGASASAEPPVQQTVRGGAGLAVSVVLRVVPLRHDAVGYDAPTYEQDVAGSSKRKVIGIVGASLAGAALVVGVTFTVLAVSKASSASNAQTSIRAAGGNGSSCMDPVATTFAGPCATLHDALVQRDTFADVALGGYLVMAAAAGATLAYLFWPGRARPAAWSPTVASVRPAPLVGSGVGGVMLSGAF
jgi:hypothetical protein